MKTLRYLVLLLALCYSQLSLANESIIRGTIIDDENAEPLFAANAGVVGSSVGASADFDGNFELKIESGTHTLSFSFIGYQTLQISEIEVKANDVINLGTIRLKSSAIAVDVVTVTAEDVKNTETALLTIKKKSVNVIDGISSQNFKKMGDANAAAAVVRVPGVSVQGGKYVYVRGILDVLNSSFKSLNSRDGSKWFHSTRTYANLFVYYRVVSSPISETTAPKSLLNNFYLYLNKNSVPRNHSTHSYMYIKSSSRALTDGKNGWATPSYGGYRIGVSRNNSEDFVHEVGHTLGAIHFDHTVWDSSLGWFGWWGESIMHSSTGGSSWHADVQWKYYSSENRSTVKSTLNN